MNCKRGLTALLAVLCLSLAVGPALAAEPPLSEQEELAAIQAELEADEAGQAVPSIPPAAGGVGLAVLFLLGLITSRKHREQEEAGYDPILEDRRIGDPYSRLAGKEKRPHRFL